MVLGILLSAKRNVNNNLTIAKQTLDASCVYVRWWWRWTVASGCSRRVCFSKYIFCLLLIGRSQAKKIKAIFVVFVCRRIYLRLELNGRRIVLLCFKSNGCDRKLGVTQLIQDVCANHSHLAASICSRTCINWRTFFCGGGCDGHDNGDNDDHHRNLFVHSDCLATTVWNASESQGEWRKSMEFT